MPWPLRLKFNDNDGRILATNGPTMSDIQWWWLTMYNYCIWETFSRKNWQIESNSPKFCLQIFTNSYSKNVFGICTDRSLFVKFFPANSFYLYGSPKFPSPKFSSVYYLFLYCNDYWWNCMALLITTCALWIR